MIRDRPACAVSAVFCLNFLTRPSPEDACPMRPTPLPSSPPPSVVRRSLDGLYSAGGILAAVALFGIFALILLQVIANCIDFASRLLTGTAIGLAVPSYTDFSGFLLVGASFLALAATFRAGGHIRVSLILQALPSYVRRITNVVCALLAGGLTLYMSWYCWELVMDSIEFGDVSSGLIPVPLWIPQSVMALGVSVLGVAVCDSLLAGLMGQSDPALDSLEGGE